MTRLIDVQEYQGISICLYDDGPGIGYSLVLDDEDVMEEITSEYGFESQSEALAKAQKVIDSW